MPAIIRLLETLLLKNQTAREKERILQEEFAIPMTQKMEEEVEEMCNLSQGIENRGIRKGRELGLREGIQRGASQGYLSSLKSLMKTTGWPLERALAALEISGEEEKRFRKLLEEENEKGRKAVSQKRKMKRE